MSLLDRINPDERRLVEEATSTVPVKLGALAQALGISVYKATLDPLISGEIKPDGEGSYIIRVNRHEPKNRQRFTLAHEIAHYLLHRSVIHSGIKDDTLYRSNLSDAYEVEANKLAADILMPKKKIREEYAKLSLEDREAVVENLASRFAVSNEAMRIRLGL